MVNPIHVIATLCLVIGCIAAVYFKESSLMLCGLINYWGVILFHKIEEK